MNGEREPHVTAQSQVKGKYRRDAEPPAARAGRALWPSRCARARWPCNVARAFRVRETNTTVKVIAVSTFQPRFRVSTSCDKTLDARKKKGAVPVQKHRVHEANQMGSMSDLWAFGFAAGGRLPSWLRSRRSPVGHHQWRRRHHRDRTRALSAVRPRTRAASRSGMLLPGKMLRGQRYAMTAGT